MSLATLYSSFNGSVESSEEIDLLGSEVGSSLETKLEPLTRLKPVLGEDWKISEAQIPHKQMGVEERERTLPVYVPPQTTTYRKRSFSGTFRVYTDTQPGTVRFEKQTYYVRVLRWFTLDGKINDNVRLFAYFWDDDGTLKYYVVFAFKDPDIENGFFYHAYWPERASHRFTRPRVLVFSHEGQTAFGRKWPAGSFLLMELEFGDKLKAAASGTETPLKFGGPLNVADGQFTFDLVSWPERALTFHGGKMVVENVRLYAKMRDWSDGEEPRTVEGDDEDDNDSDDDSPDPKDVQFTLAGHLKLTDEVKPGIWTTLPPDGGVACWRPGRVGVKLSKASLLDTVFGTQGWLSAFGGDFENYTLEDLDLTVDLPSRELVFGSYVISGNLTLKNAAPDVIKLPQAHICYQVSFPGRDARQESVDIECDTTVYGTLFEIRGDLAQRAVTFTSADGEGYDKWSQSFWCAKALTEERFERSEVEGIYDRLHVWVDLKEQTHTVGVSNDAGDFRWI
ncbi:MAG: hypothetical protein KDD47_17605 [Acidobacteria bacterium]|nr:hypothetical protein [Acidobacteriota bacterium]